jgi:hypothetical protein
MARLKPCLDDADESGMAAGGSGQGRSTPMRRSLVLMVLAVAIETMSILPVVDRLADANPTVHFTQHGLIFLGGLLIGVALRDAFRLSQLS